MTEQVDADIQPGATDASALPHAPMAMPEQELERRVSSAQGLAFLLQWIFGVGNRVP